MPEITDMVDSTAVITMDTTLEPASESTEREESPNGSQNESIETPFSSGIATTIRLAKRQTRLIPAIKIIKCSSRCLCYAPTIDWEKIIRDLRTSNYLVSSGNETPPGVLKQSNPALLSRSESIVDLTKPHLLPCPESMIDLTQSPDSVRCGYGRAYPSYTIADAVTVDYKEYRREYKRHERAIVELSEQRRRLWYVLKALATKYLELGGKEEDTAYMRMKVGLGIDPVEREKVQKCQAETRLTDEYIDTARAQWRIEVGEKVIFKYEPFSPTSMKHRTRQKEKKADKLRDYVKRGNDHVLEARRQVDALNTNNITKDDVVLSAVPSHVLRIFKYSQAGISN